MATVSVQPSGAGTAQAPRGWDQVARQGVMLAASCFLMPVALGGVPGSGGAMTPEAVLSRQQLLKDEFIDIAEAAAQPSETDSRTIAELLEHVRLALGLTVTDLAWLLDASRPTVYAWFNGQEPRPEVLMTLMRLERQAVTVAACELPRLNKLVRRPLRCGGTLLERLRNDEALEPALDELKVLARREEDARSHRKGFIAAKRSAREALEDVSTPLDRQG